MFLRLEHTAIASPSPLKLAQWYVDHLGFRINFEYDGNYFVRAANGTVLETIPSEGPRGDQKMRDPGIRHLAIAVADFDAAYAALRERSVNFLGEPYVNQGNRLVFFTDCDGNLEIRHLAIAVADFDAAYAALRERSVNFLGEPYVNQGNRLVFFTDCDGNL